MGKNNTVVVSGRNYQIDVLKLICSLLVLLNHTSLLLVSPLYEKFCNFGWISVHIFFMISGFLMVKKISEKNIDEISPGKISLDFVIEKFKKLFLPFVTAVFITLITYICYYIYIYIYICG